MPRVHWQSNLTFQVDLRLRIKRAPIFAEDRRRANFSSVLCVPYKHADQKIGRHAMAG